MSAGHPTLSGVLEAALYVDDLDTAEAFYGGVLGLEKVLSVEGRHVFFRCGETIVLLFIAGKTRQANMDSEFPVPPHGATGAGHICFAVAGKDMNPWRNRFEQAGIAIESDFNWPNGARSIYIRDPAGNSVEFAEPKLWETKHDKNRQAIPMTKVALITAGGSGMGAAAARKLAEHGFQVAVLSSSGKGEALAVELGGIGVTGSNQNNDDLGKLVDGAMEKWGRIDVLVNSAGHGPRAPILEITDEDWHKGLDVYMLSAVRPSRLVTPIMVEQNGGVIINISTFAAFEPDPVFPTSGVFRAGLAAYTKLFADHYASDNVRMNNVLPGFIDSLPEKEAFRARIPMQRYGKSEEIAETIAFLASRVQGISQVKTSGSTGE